jgi:chaperone BCS1
MTILLVIPTFAKTVNDVKVVAEGWLLHILSIQFSVSNQNSRFFLYQTALSKLVPKAKRLKEVDILGKGPSWMRDEDEVEIDMQPAHGVYWFKFEGTRVRACYMEKEGNGNGSGVKALSSSESLTFDFFTKKRKVISAFRRYVADLERENRRLRTTIWSNRWGSWVPIAKRHPRGENTLFYDNHAHKEILSDLHWFQEAEHEYRDRGRVHKRGYIFYGPPGNGKTTLILWLASQLGMDVAILSSCSDDETFLGLVTRVPKGAVLLLEDVDALFASAKSREEEPVAEEEGDSEESLKKAAAATSKTVTLSVLLNYLDGMLSREGQIVFMTTNYYDRIDPALLRRGRADRRLFLGPPSEETAQRMFGSAYPETESGPFIKALADLKTKPSAADLEGLFDRFGPEKVLDHLAGETHA